MAFKALPRPQFSTLQQKIFPVYFGIQTALPVILALTYPGTKPLGASGLSGAFADVNRWSVAVPILTTLVAGLANLIFIGPATTNIMKERKHQGKTSKNVVESTIANHSLETRDGKKSYDPAPHSKEMQKLNRAFGRMHGASTLINLAGFLATAWYGVVLSERLQ